MLNTWATQTILTMVLTMGRPAMSSTIDVIPKGVVDGISVGQYVSSESGFDHAKVLPINSTSFDWWFFNVVSDDLQYTTTISFLATPGTGFDLSGLPNTDMLLAVVELTTPDQSTELFHPMPATEAVIIGEGDGASGFWKGTGIQFYGSEDMSEYRVDIDMPSVETFGYVSLKSIAPAHYPAGPARAGESMELLPGLGWANAVPDAEAEVMLLVNGTQVKFTGTGYHDKNWGTATFTDGVSSWYWGHGRLGPYSLVWFDIVTPSGEEYVSVYVAEAGEILYVNNSNLIVRPTGPSARYPPLIGDVPDGLAIEIDMGDKGIMDISISNTPVSTQGNFYTRLSGSMIGGIRGQANHTGVALMEQLATVSE